MPDSHARALFAARLIQARTLRGLSQRALGDRMGLGKEKGSSRINRYENRVTAIGFDNLNAIAGILDVPVAYLLADNASIADAILALSKTSEDQQALLAQLIDRLASHPELIDVLMAALQSPEGGSAVSHALRTPKPSKGKKSP